MTPLIILEIVKLSLELTLEIIKGIPLEQRQQMWREHEKRLAFWEDLVEKALKLEKTP